MPQNPPKEVKDVKQGECRCTCGNVHPDESLPPKEVKPCCMLCISQWPLGRGGICNCLCHSKQEVYKQSEGGECKNCGKWLGGSLGMNGNGEQSYHFCKQEAKEIKQLKMENLMRVDQDNLWDGEFMYVKQGAKEKCGGTCKHCPYYNNDCPKDHPQPSQECKCMEVGCTKPANDQYNCWCNKHGLEHEKLVVTPTSTTGEWEKGFMETLEALEEGVISRQRVLKLTRHILACTAESAKRNEREEIGMRIWQWAATQLDAPSFKREMIKLAEEYYQKVYGQKPKDREKEPTYGDSRKLRKLVPSEWSFADRFSFTKKEK